MKKQSKKPNPSNRRPAVRHEPLEARQLLSGSGSSELVYPNATLIPSAGAASIAGYTPAQIRSAYGFNDSALTGAGQTIAIVDAYNDPNIASDLAVFDSEFKLPAPPSLKIVSQTGGSASSIQTNAGWGGEISLDVEWAHAIAPGANILLVEADNSSLTDLMAAVNYARSAPGVSVVTMSWGGSEFYGETSYDTDFTTPAGHQGVTFVAASGDQGSAEGVEYPASSPNVVSVGGTTLMTSGSTGTYSSESAWADSTGGQSAVEPEPAYQKSVQSTGARTVPDVSYDANPDTGVAVYDSVPYEGESGWQEFGGTSASAQQWGALVALADQARVTAKLGTLDGATQTLPDLYTAASTATTYTANFHEISVTTTTRNPFSGFGFGFGFGRYSPPVTTTTTGYNEITGLGTPKANTLIVTLSDDGTVAATTTKTTSVTLALSQTVPDFVRPTPPAGDPIFVLSASSSAALAISQARSASGSPSGSFSVFNDTLLNRDVPTPSGAGARIGALADVPPLTSIAATAVAGWAGANDGSLVSWMIGTADHEGLTSGGPSGSEAALTTAGTAMAGVKHFAAPLASPIVSALAAPLISAPARVLYRFASFDPVRMFSDSMAEFARISASISPLDAPQAHSQRAWLITSIVLGVDGFLAARWYALRRKEKKQASGNGSAKSLF